MSWTNFDSKLVSYRPTNSYSILGKNNTNNNRPNGPNINPPQNHLVGLLFLCLANIALNIELNIANNSHIP